MIKCVYCSSAKYSLILSDFAVTLIFVKYSNIKFHENPSSGSRQTEKRTDMRKLIVVFRNFAKAPKNAQHFIRVSRNPERALAEPQGFEKPLFKHAVLTHRHDVVTH
jgi:hypothetical protein